MEICWMVLVVTKLFIKKKILLGGHLTGGLLMLLDHRDYLKETNLASL